MACEKYINLISELVDNELSSQQECTLRAHIEQCSDCKRVYDAFMGISDALGQDLVEPPEMLAKGVMFKIKAHHKGGSRRHFAFGRFTALAACLTLMLFGASQFGLLDGLKSPSTNNDAVPQSNSYSVGAADQAPAYLDPSENDLPDTQAPPSKVIDGVLLPPPSVTPALVPPPEGSLFTSFGSTFQEIIENSVSNNQSPSQFIPLLLVDAKELEVYTGSYLYDFEKAELEKGRLEKASENSLIVKLTDSKDFLPLMDFIKSTRATKDIKQDAALPELKNEDALYSFIIPAQAEKPEEATSLRIIIYHKNEKLWCKTTEHLADGTVKGKPFVYEVAGPLNELEKFVAAITPVPTR